MVEITQAQLFEMMGRLYAEVQGLTAKNTRLEALLKQAQQENVAKKEKRSGR